MIRTRANYRFNVSWFKFKFRLEFVFGFKFVLGLVYMVKFQQSSVRYKVRPRFMLNLVLGTQLILLLGLGLWLILRSESDYGQT